MASRLNHERRNAVVRLNAARREWTPVNPAAYPPARTGFECEACGLDQAVFGSRFRFNQHRKACATTAVAA